MASKRGFKPNKRAHPGEALPENPIGGLCGVSGKTRWPSRRGARSQLLRLRQGGWRAGDLRVYRCDGCGYWHVGHRGDDPPPPDKPMVEGQDVV